MSDNGARRFLICSAAILTPEGYELNIGDEALSECLELGIRDRLEGAQVERTLNPGGAPPEMLGPRIAVRPRSELFRAIRRSDTVILGGGTLLQDDRPLLHYGLGIAMLAKAARKPLRITAVGAEHIERPGVSGEARAICRMASSVTVRDTRSAMLVERVTGIRPIVAADPLFLPAALRKLPPPVEAQGERICVNLRDDAPPQLIDALGTLLAKRIDEGARVTLLATDRRPDRDPAALGALAEKLDSRSVDVLPSDVGWRAAYEAISQSTLCVGMRLHFCIFSAVARRRLLVLSSTPKTKSFINDLQLAHRPIESAHDDIASGLDEARTADEPGLTHMATRANRALEAILG